jgi:hypothetical protein
MTRQEFSDQFDVLLNSYDIQASFGEGASRQDIVLDEYEKSVLLTQSQDDVVIDLYTGKNAYGDSFERTEELRRYLSELVSEVQLSPTRNSTGVLGMGSNSKFFTLPKDLWFITYEQVNVSDAKCEGSSTLDVVQVTQDEYHKIKRNPFRGASGRRALRLDLADGVVEIVCKYPVESYYLRYLVKVNPIILINLTDGQTINDESMAMECELPEVLHQRILERAVLMALQSRGYRVPQSTQEQV